MDIKELLERQASLIREMEHGYCDDGMEYAAREELADIIGEIAVVEQKAITKFYKDIITKMIEFPTVPRTLEVPQNKKEK